MWARAEPDLPWLAVDCAAVKLLNGDVFVVEGTLHEVEAKPRMLLDQANPGLPGSPSMEPMVQLALTRPTLRA